MSVKKTLMTDENLFGFSEIEGSNTDSALILEEIVRELQEFLCSKSTMLIQQMVYLKL